MTSSVCLNGDLAGFASAYQGDGRFEIVIINDSDRELELQVSHII